MLEKFINLITRELPTKSVTTSQTAVVKNFVDYSVGKYEKTYKLLEEYDKQSKSDPTVLVDPGRMREYLSRFQRKD